MPGRTIPMVSGEIYHVVNRGIAGQPIFLNKKGYQRFLDSMFYYQNIHTPISYSQFILLSTYTKNDILKSFAKMKDFMVEFISFCLMPNHFHLLIRQVSDSGIAKFIGNLSNSYTRYFNSRNKRNGPILQGKFKAVRIENDVQLNHVSRYIHLNPYTSYVVKKIEDIFSYPYSSCKDYVGVNNQGTINKEIILGNFKTIKSYKNFIIDQADYQRKLDFIKHLTFEK